MFQKKQQQEDNIYNIIIGGLIGIGIGYILSGIELHNNNALAARIGYSAGGINYSGTSPWHITGAKNRDTHHPTGGVQKWGRNVFDTHSFS